MTFPHYNDDNTLLKNNHSAAALGLKPLSPPAVEKLNPSPPLAADEPLLGEARGQDTIVISETPEKLKAVGMVFYDRKSRVEILDCYLKVTAF